MSWSLAPSLPFPEQAQVLPSSLLLLAYVTCVPLHFCTTAHVLANKRKGVCAEAVICPCLLGLWVTCHNWQMRPSVMFLGLSSSVVPKAAVARRTGCRSLQLPAPPEIRAGP